MKLFKKNLKQAKQKINKGSNDSQISAEEQPSQPQNSILSPDLFKSQKQKEKEQKDKEREEKRELLRQI